MDWGRKVTPPANKSAVCSLIGFTRPCITWTQFKPPTTLESTWGTSVVGGLTHCLAYSYRTVRSDTTNYATCMNITKARHTTRVVLRYILYVWEWKWSWVDSSTLPVALPVAYSLCARVHRFFLLPCQRCVAKPNREHNQPIVTCPLVSLWALLLAFKHQLLAVNAPSGKNQNSTS